jgi:hypothetical protein
VFCSALSESPPSSDSELNTDLGIDIYKTKAKRCHSARRICSALAIRRCPILTTEQVPARFCWRGHRMPAVASRFDSMG